MRSFRWIFCLLLGLAFAAGVTASAATLTRAELARRFPPPLLVGERASDVPAWPLFRQNGTATELAGYAFAPALADRLVELEPFKTAVTLNFVRAWPYVAHAAGLLVLGMLVYKGFCRYLCPFGAALALLGRVRVLDWIPRRAECGTPCQTCRHRCGYQAIAPQGTVDYGECFQCMECVVIHDSDTQCAPRILERKRARTIAIVPARDIIDRRA
jgi:hypothetical protein